MAMKDWYVYQADGNHIGPVSTDLLARGLLAGKVPRDAHVGAMGDAKWQPLLEVAEIQAATRALEGTPIQPRPVSSVPPAPPPADPPTWKDVNKAAELASQMPANAPVPVIALPAVEAAPAPAAAKPEEKKDD